MPGPGLSLPPPLPPSGGGEGSPSYSSMIPPQEEQQPEMGGGAGLSQTGNAAIRVAMELDASMKVLAQMVPQLASWAEQATSQLRSQLGAILNNGDLPTGAEPSENHQFPGGQGLL